MVMFLWLDSSFFSFLVWVWVECSEVFLVSLMFIISFGWVEFGKNCCGMKWNIISENMNRLMVVVIIY